MSEANIPTDGNAQLQELAALPWQRLGLLTRQFLANCRALESRKGGGKGGEGMRGGYPELAARLRSHTPSGEYLVAVRGTELVVGKLAEGKLVVSDCLLSATESRAALLKLFPQGRCTESLFIAGVDQGWSWELIHGMPVEEGGRVAQGHKPPLYFLTRELEDLWVALHLHQWEKLLTDHRVWLGVGPDGVVQLAQFLKEHMEYTCPRMGMTLEPSLWQNAQSIDCVEKLCLQVQLHRAWEFKAATEACARVYGPDQAERIVRKLRSGEQLRILGVTTRYSMVIKQAMRDWLAAFAQMGHQTRLLIEEADHEIYPQAYSAQVCAEFQPDLLLMVDHYRAELNIWPAALPCVMWVQDRLPNIFCPEAGAAQGPRDFCLGFGRLHLSTRYGYPPQRYLSTPMGVNVDRFQQGTLSPDAAARFGCDVSYISHAGTPAEVLLQRQLAATESPLHRQLLTETFERIRGAFESGELVLTDLSIRLVLEEVLTSHGWHLAEEVLQPLIYFFNQQIVSVLYRHQALEWVAQLGVDLRLYGQGWEHHPRLHKYAHGVADNHRDVPLIYQASKINLQLMPHGAVHPRLLDGLAAGGFFLLRWQPGDQVGPLYEQLWHWHQQQGITNNEQLHAKADAQMRALIDRINELEGIPPPSPSQVQRRETTVFDIMQGHQDNAFMTSAASIWPEYGQVAFKNQQELTEKVGYFLREPAARAGLAESMRQVVVAKLSYVSINQRLLALMARELESRKG